jgi:hypothetical protein
MANVKDRDDFAAFERLLNAAYRYTDGHKAGLSDKERSIRTLPAMILLRARELRRSMVRAHEQPTGTFAPLTPLFGLVSYTRAGWALLPVFFIEAA